MNIGRLSVYFYIRMHNQYSFRKYYTSPLLMLSVVTLFLHVADIHDKEPREILLPIL